ncbi:ABC transporter ATP-binding protein [Gemmatimonas sp.]|uniref:ABC transporter ATP-binding protein n=1 Tax=Gemmatimonas sp. TaxID=1962908 RepID=UPI0035692BB3
MDLDLQDLQKQFSVGGETIVALNGVNLEVPDGQFVTVMGSNGAGKSTVLNTVAGALVVDSGKVTLGGRDITRMSEHRRARMIGRVFQDPRIGTAPALTVAENIALAALRPKRRTLRRGVPSVLRAEVIERFERCGLDDLCDRLDQQVGTLSGGQRQAVSLLMATWEHPALLLLDEHTAALDPKRASEIMALTARIQAESELTVLMVTHDVDQAIAFGDRLIMMDRGRIIDDIAGADKSALTFESVIELFHKKGMSMDDRTVLRNEGGPDAS